MLDLLNPVNIFAIVFEVLIKGLFAYSIIKLFKEILPENRKIEPRLLWLLVIPGFNLLWNFYVAIRVSASIKNELTSRNFDVKNLPTLTLGIVFSILSASAIFIPVPTKVTSNISLLYGVLGLVAFAFFVQYWIKINWYKELFIKDSADNDQKIEI